MPIVTTTLFGGENTWKLACFFCFHALISRDNSHFTEEMHNFSIQNDEMVDLFTITSSPLVM